MEGYTISRLSIGQSASSSKTISEYDVYAFGMQLPGPGTIYLGQTLSFRAPVHIGDTITATVTVTAIDMDKGCVELETLCTNQAGVPVITGSAKVMPPKG